MDFLLIDVDSINHDVSNCSFEENDIIIENLANSILESKGLLTPLVVKKSGINSYDLVYGNVGYYAAVKACKIDPQKGEMIGAFVIENDKENAIKKQVEFLKKSHDNQLPEKTTSRENNSEQNLRKIEIRLTNIESRLETKINELKQDYQNQIDDLKNQIKENPKNLPETVEALQAFNTFSLEKLTSSLSKINFPNKSKIISNIIKARETKGEFKSFIDLINKVDKLGDKTVIKIIDHFSN